MKSLLLVIDMQKAFINKNTEFLIEKINTLVKSEKYNDIVFTRFINTKESLFVKKLNYYGCIEDDKEIVVKTKKNKVFDKKTYTALNNDLKNYIEKNEIDKIYLCGIDTAACVLKTALDLFENGYDVYVLKEYCASTHGYERNKNALEILKRNIGENSII